MDDVDKPVAFKIVLVLGCAIKCSEFLTVPRPTFNIPICIAA